MSEHTSTTVSDSSQQSLFEQPHLAPKRTRFTNEQRRQIAAEYEAGEGTPALRRRWGGSQGKIERAVVAGGGRLRTSVEAHMIPSYRRRASDAHRAFSDEQEKLIVADYLAEMSHAGIKAKWQCSIDAIYGALRRAGLTPRPRNHTTPHKRHVLRTMHRLLTDEQETELAHAYVNDPLMSAAMLGRRYGVCEATALNVLKRRGVDRRDFTPKMLVPETYFDDADSDPIKAYLVGLYLADGCVCRLRDESGRVLRSASVTLYLCNDDKEHLKTIRALLGIEHKIVTVVNKTGFGRNPTQAHRLSVTSERLALGLERWGVKERKSWGCRFIGLQNSRDAWRGAVDGDGWIGYRPCGGMMQPHIGLCGAPGVVMQFMDFSRTVLDTNAKPFKRGDTHWRINFAGWSAVQIVRALYADNPIALPRKNETAQRIISDFASIPSDRRARLPDGTSRRLTAHRFKS